MMTPDAWERDLLSASEASRLLGIPEGTLSTWRARRVGPPFVRLGARSPRYSRAALTEWIAERSVKP